MEEIRVVNDILQNLDDEEETKVEDEIEGRTRLGKYDIPDQSV